MNSTLIKVTLKGIEGVSNAYSVVYLHSHRQPLKQETVSLLLSAAFRAYDLFPLKTLLNKWDQGSRKPELRKCV